MAPRRAALVLVLLLAGCAAEPAPGPTAGASADLQGPRGLAPSDAESCAELAVAVVDVIQEYVDSFDAGEGFLAPSAESQEALSVATGSAGDRAASLGCGDGYADLVREEVRRLRGDTAVREAVAATFRAGPLGTADPADTGPLQLEAASTDELVAALAVAGAGSTITLTGSVYELTTPLAVLYPVTLVGAGADRTELRSRAEGAAVLVATHGDVGLRDLAVVHHGDAAASVVVVASGGYAFEGLRLEGGRAVEGAGGYGMVLRPEPGPFSGGDVRQEVRDVEVVGGTGGGVVVGGSQAPTIEGLRVHGTGGCALCYVEESGGTVTGADLADASVGLRVDDDAGPALTAVTVSGAQVGVALTGAGSPELTGVTVGAADMGLELGGTGAARLTDVTVEDAAEVGLRISGTAAPVVTGAQLTGATLAGLAVVEDAAPELSEISVRTTGEVGAIWGGAAAGGAEGLTVDGPRVGIQLGDSTRAALSRVSVAAAGGAAVLAAGTAAGSLDGVSCGGGALALTESTTVSLGTTDGCEIVDQR